MSLPASELLLTFKTKIEEAVGLVPEMVVGEKLKAVQFWNMVSERLQDIVNNSAADINALAMKMAKEGAVEQLPVMDGGCDHPTACDESPKDFIVAPSFVPANDYEVECQNVADNNNNDEESPDVLETVGSFSEEADLKTEPLSKVLESDTLAGGSADSNQSSSGPAANDSFSLEVNELVTCAKENFPLIKTELNLSHSKKGFRRKKQNFKRGSKQMLHRKLKSEVKESCQTSKFSALQKRKDVLQTLPVPCSSESKEDSHDSENKGVLLENSAHIDNNEDSQKTTEIVLIQSDYSNVLKTYKFPPYVCEWCNTEFLSAATLSSHQWTHLKPYACAECTSRFSTKGNLIVHQRSHTGEKPFRCDQCDACFTTNSNLRRHAKTHTGEKPWECPQCGKRYTEKKSLKVHLRRHTGEKPYQCPICLKDFSQTGILQTHMALHLDQKAHLCDSCGKSFRQRSQLRLHKLRHEGVKKYTCVDCPADFLTKGDLERHKRVHTGERPFVCELCGKTYTRQQSLNEHMNRHYGLKPYECKYCIRKFAEMSACYKHIKHHERSKNKKEEEEDPVDDFQILPSDGEMTFEVCSEGMELNTL